MPRYSNNNDIKQCQYGWQENELADFGQWLLRQLLLLAGVPGSNCGTALLLTYNSPSTHARTHSCSV